MKRCVKCSVDVRGDQDKCPLCQTELTGKAEPPLYPHIQTVYKQHASLFRLLALTSVSVIAVAGAVNLLLPTTGHWAVFVLVGVACFWLCLLSGIKTQYNIPHNITNQSIFAAGFCFLWDWLTGWHRWSINYAVPIVFTAAMLIMAIISQVRKISVDDFIFYLVVNALFGIIPLIFYLAGAVDQVIPSLICIVSSVISLAAVLIFHGKEIGNSIAKRLHM